MRNINLNAKQTLENMKYEIATELGVDLSKGGGLTSYEAGKVGSQLTKAVWDSFKGNSRRNY